MEIVYLSLSEVDSTQEWAKAHLQEFEKGKLICITAESQTAGRGRTAGRKWISKKGNLHMTLFLWSPPQPNLAQILAFSAAEILQAKGISVQIKWPNDLIAQGKKLAGAMAEGISEGVLLGIGINVNQPIQTDQATICLRELSQTEWDLQMLTHEIPLAFLKNLENGFASIKQAFEKKLLYRGETIRCQWGSKTVQGKCLGITEKGLLRIQLKEGALLEILSGEIHSVRAVDPNSPYTEKQMKEDP